MTVDEKYKKRQIQITLAKSLSSKAKHELLATALSGKNLYKVYEICPKCSVPAVIHQIFQLHFSELGLNDNRAYHVKYYLVFSTLVFILSSLIFLNSLQISVFLSSFGFHFNEETLLSEVS